MAAGAFQVQRTERTTKPDGSVWEQTYDNFSGELLRERQVSAPPPAPAPAPTPAPQTTYAQGQTATPSTAYSSVPTATYSGPTQSGQRVTQNTYEQSLLQQEQAALASKQLTQQSELQAAAERRRLANIQGLLSGGGAANAVPNGGTSPQEEAARAAAFARMKDTQGSIALQQVKALENASAGRGLQGSTIEQGYLGDIIAERGGAMQDAVGAQAIADVNRAADVADMQYQGAITQRGQDLDAQRAIYALITAGAY